MTFRVTLWRCPRCGDDDLRPSQQRNLLEKIFFTILQISPVRCMQCMRRSFLISPMTRGTARGPVKDSSDSRSAKSNNSIGHWLLIWAALLSCAFQLWWFGVRCIHQIDYDAIGYTGISTELKQGLFHSSINGFRSPLISWLIAAVPALTVFQSGKLISIAAYLLIIFFLYIFTYRLWRSKIVAGTTVLLFTLARGITFDAVGFISPDLLVTLLVVIYFLVLVECLRHDRHWLLLGGVHGAAFLAKAFALPWLALITLAAVIISSGRLRQKTIRLGAAALMPILVAVLWASFLHSKYDVFTTGTQFKTNYLQWTVRAYRDHRSTTYTVLRDITVDTDDHMVDDPMAPGTWPWSYKLSVGQALPAIFKAELRNVPQMTKEMLILVNPGVLLAFFVLFFLLWRKRDAGSRSEWALMAIMLFASLALVIAYSMLVFDSRYLLPLVPLYMAFGVRFLVHYPGVNKPRLRYACWVLVIVGVVTSLVYRSSPFRTQTRDFQEVCYRAGATLAKNNGTSVVSIGSGPFQEHGVGWEAGYKAAYFGGKRLIATHETSPTSEELFALEVDVRKASAASVIFWGHDDSVRRGLINALSDSYVLQDKILDPKLGDVGVVLFRRKAT
jgi:hypothetical protein